MRLKTNTAKIYLFLIGCVWALIAAEITLRVYNPFQARVRGDEIILPVYFHYNFELKNAKKMDKVVSHTKNSLGFRGEEMPEELEKYLSIVSIGGSTTEDFFMTDGKTWTAHLGKKLRESFYPIWINNAGLDGHSSFGHTVLMNAFISKIKPKVVLFLVGSNDRGLESMQRFDSGLKNGLTLEITSIKAFLRTAGNYSEVLALSYNLYRYLKKIDVSYSGDEINMKKVEVLEIQKEKELEIINEKFKEHKENYLEGYSIRLKNLIKISRENNIRPVLITQPALYGNEIDDVTKVDLGTIAVEGANGKIAWKIFEFYNDITREVGRAQKVLVIDLAKEMPKSTRYYYDYYHFTNAGTEKVAEIIHNKLQPFLENNFSNYSKNIN
jgi:lysophospholipase L1-like esterase